MTAFKKKAISLGTEYVVGKADSFDFEVHAQTSLEGQSEQYRQPYRLNVCQIAFVIYNFSHTWVINRFYIQIRFEICFVMFVNTCKI